MRAKGVRIRTFGLATIGASIALLVGLGPVAVRAAYGTVPALQLPWPTGLKRNVSGFTYGSAHQVCSGYRSDHVGLEAYAIDFGLTNEEVDAAAYGQVGAIGYDAVGGEYVWIKHPNNLQTYYGHLSTNPGDIYVTVNEWISKGQRIAKSDTSGGASGPHLHFRVTTGGTSPFTGTAYKPEPMSGVTPPGYVGWDNYGCNINTTTTFNSTPPNEQVAVAARSDGTQALLLRGTDSRAWFALTDASGAPGNWQSLGGIAAGVPCGSWDSGGRLDVYVIGNDGLPYRRSSTDGGTTWDPTWTRENVAPASGAGETQNINCTRRPGGTVDIFIRGTSGQGIHMSTDSSGNVVSWDSLNGTVKGPPSGAWDDLGTRLDVYAIGTDDHPYHGVWSANASPHWSGWTNVYGGYSGPAEAEIIFATHSPDGTTDVFVRGGGTSPGTAYFGYTDSAGNILGWVSLGGTIRGAAEAKAIRNGGPDSIRIDVFVIGINDQVYQITAIDGAWNPWVYWPSEIAA